MSNILFVTRTMGLGGTEKVILELCNSFRSKFNKIVVCSCGGENVEYLKSIQVEHVEIPDIATKNIFSLLKAKKIIKKTLKKYNIDVIHTHHRMAAFLCKSFKNVKLINNMHNTFEDKYFFTRLALHKYVNIAVGKIVYENLTEYYKISKNKVVLIENSINNKFDYKLITDFQNNKNENCFTFVFVGRLEEQKGIDILISAFNKIDKKCKLYIFGDGSLKSYVEAHVNDKIIYKGYTNNPLNVISQCDCVILPSRWEGLPLLIIEAMAMSKPVICSDIKNNIELVEDKITGYVFKNEDIEDLSCKIINFINSNNKDEISNNALNCYLNKYSYSIFIEKYMEIYGV